MVTGALLAGISLGWDERVAMAMVGGCRGAGLAEMIAMRRLTKNNACPYHYDGAAVGGLAQPLSHHGGAGAPTWGCRCWLWCLLFLVDVFLSFEIKSI
jgi:hypothetical protein